MAQTGLQRVAFRFVLIVGIVNLFADLTYEGARANTGPFLSMLGASAAAVGLIAGSGELLGYALRSVSGYFADKTRQYWVVIFAGYFINMPAVPALALAGNWPLAGVLIVAERTGRAIRRPAVEAMISHAGKSLGSGLVFGLNEALDQGGAAVGPLLTALVVYLHGTCHNAFAILLIPASLCLANARHCESRVSGASGTRTERTEGIREQRIFAGVLDISSGWSADRLWVCGFFTNCISFP